MPVLGHAVAGWATAKVLRPSLGPSARAGTLADALWVPIVVVLAYLPDIVSQFVLLTGRDDGRLVGHSVPLAVIGAPLLAALLSRGLRLPYGRALLVTLFSVLFHDCLDLLQSTDRAPLWPVSFHRVDEGAAIIPEDPLQEAILSGAVFAALVAWRRDWRGRLRLRPEQSADDGRHRVVVLGWILTAAIITVAVATHSLRALREKQLDGAAALLKRRDSVGALALVERAERWPSTADPGKVDCLRAEAYNEMGDRSRAERHYLSALRADPARFWTVANLADFYASSGRPLSERCWNAAPYLRRLREDFADHEDLPLVLARLARNLDRCPSPDLHLPLGVRP